MDTCKLNWNQYSFLKLKEQSRNLRKHTVHALSRHYEDKM